MHVPSSTTVLPAVGLRWRAQQCIIIIAVTVAVVAVYGRGCAEVAGVRVMRMGVAAVEVVVLWLKIAEISELGRALLVERAVNQRNRTAYLPDGPAIIIIIIIIEPLSFPHLYSFPSIFRARAQPALPSVQQMNMFQRAIKLGLACEKSGLSCNDLFSGLSDMQVGPRG